MNNSGTTQKFITIVIVDDIILFLDISFRNFTLRGNGNSIVTFQDKSTI